MNSSIIKTRLRTLLDRRKADGHFRSLVNVEGVDFWSNDYLGLAHSSEPQSDSQAKKTQNIGSTGSRLISGNDAEIEQLETDLAQFHGFEHGLLFSSGYAANSGLLSALGKKGDLLLLDQLSHASLIDGARLCHATTEFFAHNDISAMRSALEKFNQTRSSDSEQAIVVVESLYSMDGDRAPLEQMATVCAELGASLIVDEAHAVGVYGSQGEGLVGALALQSSVLATVYTFGKAVGAHGAIVVGSKLLRDYLINYSRQFIYTTAPSPHTVTELACAYKRMRAADDRRATLKQNIEYFKQCIAKTNLLACEWVESDSPIQGLLVCDTQRAKDIETKLRQDGFALKAIVSPSVALGTERIRICLHSHNTQQQIDHLVSSIEKHTLSTA